jgi:hypothetical protein
MPVVLRAKGYRFWRYAADLDESPHVHAEQEGKEAEPVELLDDKNILEKMDESSISQLHLARRN